MKQMMNKMKLVKAIFLDLSMNIPKILMGKINVQIMLTKTTGIQKEHPSRLKAMNNSPANRSEAKINATRPRLLSSFLMAGFTNFYRYFLSFKLVSKSLDEVYEVAARVGTGHCLMARINAKSDCKKRYAQ